jgi:hypothetical protein
MVMGVDLRIWRFDNLMIELSAKKHQKATTEKITLL